MFCVVSHCDVTVVACSVFRVVAHCDIKLVAMKILDGGPGSGSENQSQQAVTLQPTSQDKSHV